MSYALRHFLTLSDLTALQISTLLSEALYLEERWKKRDMPDALAGRRVALIVDDDGWRNTFAFDLGIQAMGGCCAHAQIKLGTREETADLARYLSNWVDAVVIRTKSFEQLRELADAATVPVINARTKANHPCETLGDLCFVKAQRGSIEGLKVAAVAPDANIIRSWVEAAAVLPISVTQIYPEKWHVAEGIAENARFSATTDFEEIVAADVVITDAWPSGSEGEKLRNYRITARVLDRLRPEAIFIPCPPVHRGGEVSADAMAHQTCRVIEAKAFLLHAQNALLKWVLGCPGRTPT